MPKRKKTETRYRWNIYGEGGGGKFDVVGIHSFRRPVKSHAMFIMELFVRGKKKVLTLRQETIKENAVLRNPALMPATRGRGTTINKVWGRSDESQILKRFTKKRNAAKGTYGGGGGEDKRLGGEIFQKQKDALGRPSQGRASAFSY